MYPKRRSKPAHSAKSVEVLPEFLAAVVEFDVALREYRLELAEAHAGQAAGLREREPFLLEQGDGEFLPKLRLSDVRCGENLIRNSHGHGFFPYNRAFGVHPAWARHHERSLPEAG